jgi:hypothetical protein
MNDRPPTANVAPPTAGCNGGDLDGRLGLTRAEAHALRRCAPLTPVQFKDFGRLVERGVTPLRHL